MEVSSVQTAFHQSLNSGVLGLHRSPSENSIFVKFGGQTYTIAASHGSAIKLAVEDQHIAQRSWREIVSDGVQYTVRKIFQTNFLKPVFTGLSFASRVVQGKYHSTESIIDDILARRLHELAKHQSQLESFSSSDYMQKIEKLRLGDVQGWLDSSPDLQKLEQQFSQIFIEAGQQWHNESDQSKLQAVLSEKLPTFLDSLDVSRLQEQIKNARDYFDTEAVGAIDQGVLTHRLLLVKILLQHRGDSGISDDAHQPLINLCQHTLTFYETLSSYALLTEFQKIYETDSHHSATAIEKFSHLLEYLEGISMQYMTKIYIALILVALLARNISGAEKTSDFQQYLNQYSDQLNSTQQQEIVDYADNLFRTVTITNSMQKISNIALSGIATFMNLTVLLVNFVQQVAPSLAAKHDKHDLVGTLWGQLLGNHLEKERITTRSATDTAGASADENTTLTLESSNTVIRNLLQQIIDEKTLNTTASTPAERVAGYLMILIRGINTTALELKEAFPDTKTKSAIYKSFIALVVPSGNIENKAVMDEVANLTENRQLAEICGKLVTGGEVTAQDMDFLQGLSGDASSKTGKNLSFNRKLTGAMFAINIAMLVTDLTLTYGYPEERNKLLSNQGGALDYLYTLMTRPILMATFIGTTNLVAAGRVSQHGWDVAKNMMTRLVMSAPAILFWRQSNTAANTVGAAINTIGSTAPERDTHIAYTKLQLEEKLAKISTFLQAYGTKTWQDIEAKVEQKAPQTDDQSIHCPEADSSWDAYLDQRRHDITKVAETYRQWLEDNEFNEEDFW